jgi:hypothetical protein
LFQDLELFNHAKCRVLFNHCVVGFRPFGHLPFWNQFGEEKFSVIILELFNNAKWQVFSSHCAVGFQFGHLSFWNQFGDDKFSIMNT